MDQRRILVIAGSDSSGGAGLEADQKVIAAHGCYAMTATTALTAQNTQMVTGIHIVPPDFLEKQIDASVGDIGVDIVKTGMLASAESIRVVAKALKRHDVHRSVVDPVMVATSGAQLLPQDAVSVLRQELLPLTTVLTPNLPEAILILKDAGQDVPTPRMIDDLAQIARDVQALGPRYVLLKGGHLPLTRGRIVSQHDADHHVVVDILQSEYVTLTFESEYIESRNTHGTGCSLASAIACQLVLGAEIDTAVRSARDYVAAGIRHSYSLGAGSGPLNHFHSSYMLPFAPGYFINYLLDHPRIKNHWRHYIHHDFVYKLADGELPESAFRHYMIQDYLFLKSFARSHALSAYKAPSIADTAAAASIVAHIESEMSLHLSYCAEFGLNQENIETREEDVATTAYTRYVLDIGARQDWFALQIALAPCLLGYGAIAEHLVKNDYSRPKGNKYWKWVETYIGEDFQTAVKKGRDLIEKHARDVSPKQVERLVEIFAHATKMEIGFWDMGLAAGRDDFASMPKRKRSGDS